MINSPTENVKLTLEQLQQLDTFNSRLASLQSEISTSVKSIQAHRLELEQILKDKDYHSSIKDSLIHDIEALEQRKDSLVATLADAQSTLDSILKESQETSERRLATIEDLNKREKDLSDREKEFGAKVDDYNIRIGRLSDDEVKIKESKKILSEAIEKL